MSKKTTIILKKNKINIGTKGNILTVSRGYAFNYLIPNYIAELATKGKIKHFKMFENFKKLEEEKIKQQANTILSTLKIINKINIKKQIGENKQIFGKIHEKDILKQISIYINHLLDKKNLDIPNIKHIGTYSASVHIFDFSTTDLQLNIIPKTSEINI